MAEQVTPLRNTTKGPRLATLAAALTAFPSVVFLAYFMLVEAAGGRNPLGANWRLVYGFSMLLAIVCAPLALLIGVVGSFRHERRRYLIAWVAIALLGGFVALGRSSFWF